MIKTNEQTSDIDMTTLNLSKENMYRRDHFVAAGQRHAIEDLPVYRLKEGDENCIFHIFL